MSVRDDILRTLSTLGPSSMAEIHDATGHLKKTLQSKLWDLRHAQQVARDEDGKYTALVAPPEEVPVEPGEDQPGPQARGRATLPGPVEGDRPGPQAKDTLGPQARGRPMRQPISGDKDRFRALLQDCGVTKALDTITDTFFSGDTRNLEYLIQVLEDAKAYVSPDQRRLMVAYWVSYIDSPPLSPELEERLRAAKGGKQLAVAGAGAGSQYPEGTGWKVEKDKHEEWVPKPGGELTYQESLRWASLMNASRPEEEEEDDEEKGGRGRGRRRGGGESVQDMLIKAMIGRAFPENGGSAADERVKELEKQLADERENRLNDRLDGLQASIDAAANRGDPVADLVKQRDQMQALGLIPTASAGVPSASPSVALIQDASDKLDKNANRIAGALERFLLRNHDLVPEPGDGAQLEEQAGELADRMEASQRARDLSRDLYRSGGHA